jgi:hypothetical protein
MNLVALVHEVVSRLYTKDRQLFTRVPTEMVAAIYATKMLANEIGEVTGEYEPSDHELRDLWHILREHV